MGNNIPKLTIVGKRHLVIDGYKFCNSCQKNQPVSNYYKCLKNSHGLQSKCKDCKKSYLANNKDKRDAYLQRYMQKRGKELLAYKKQWRKELRAKAIEIYGSECVKCGFNDYRALQFDHVNGGGYEDRKGGNTDKYYKKIINDKSGIYQLLCANCNWIKREVNQEWKKN